MKTIEDLEENYEIDFEEILSEIEKEKAKLVLLQFADGLKPYATAIDNFLQEKTENVGFLIWLGDCFGACDTPTGVDGLGIDLIIQVGHNELMPSY